MMQSVLTKASTSRIEYISAKGPTVSHLKPSGTAPNEQFYRQLV